MMSRFLVFCGQDEVLGKQLIEVMIGKQVSKQNNKLIIDPTENNI